MKKTLLIATLLLIGLTSRADYRPLALYEMMIKAEKIVYGTIVELDSNFFTLNIEGSLTSDSGTLKIARFKDWACAVRWTEYKVGQRLFLFLMTWNNELVSMSAGNEGELPVINNAVYIHGLSIPIPPPPSASAVILKEGIIYFETENIDIYGGDFFGIKWNLEAFMKSVSFIRDCFNFKYGQYQELTDWQIKCDSLKLGKMLEESKLVKLTNFKATQKDEK